MQRAVGDFRLERLIARGGAAEVHEALQISENRRVALKLIASDTAPEGYRERFMREARAVTQLDHPNVVPVYGAGEADGQLFIAMALIEGEDLERIIAADPRLPLERVLALLRQIAAGLDAAHAIGFVHADVKPGNVMVEHPGEPGERCYLLDFGLVVGHGASPAADVGTWRGTPAYVAPEQLRGEPLGPHTDVYALAVLAYHALAGRPPYVREHDSGTLLAHLHAPPPSLTELRAELPPAVDAVIARGMAKAPDARFGTAGGLVGELSKAAASARPREGPGRPAVGAHPRPRPGNLPAPAASFVGRRVELQTAREALAGSRLLSIVGAGGVGKTALALHLAASVEAEYSGVWVLELNSIPDAAGLELALARVLGLRRAAGGSPRVALIEFIEERRLLLVLDKCEHLVAEAGSLAADLLAACPGLTILATSRAPLAVTGEHLYAPGPLGVPGQDDEPDDLLAIDSALLLVQRAGEQGIALDAGEPATAAAIGRVCARLEGIPLALELAAARLRTLSLAELERRLQEDLGVLSPRGGEGRDRRRTLDGAIDSSWRLLGARERQVLLRLAVFAGPFGPDAAAIVAGEEGGAVLDARSVVMALAEKSLVQLEAVGGSTRLRLLQPVREFCLARMSPAECGSAREAHRDYYLGLVERAAPMLDSSPSPEWLAVLDEDQLNIRAAIESGLRDGETEKALRIGVAMRNFWASRGLAVEGVELLSAALQEAGAEGSTAQRAKAHSAVAHLAAGRLFDTRAAEPHALEALALARTAGDADTAAEALIWLSWCETFAGRAAAGLARAQEAMQSASSIADPTVLGRLLDARAVALEQLGRESASRLAYESARGVLAGAGYAPGVASVENHLGDLDLSAGALGSAAAHFSHARATAEAAGDGASVAMAALNLALIDHVEGRRESARELFVDALMTNQACGDRANVAFAIFGLALTELAAERAAELHGSASHRLAQLEIVLSPLEQRLQGEELERLGTELGRELLDRAIVRGRDLLVEDVISAAEDGMELP